VNLVVTVTRATAGERQLRILVFKNQKLSAEKWLPMKEVLDVPGISKTDLTLVPVPSRAGVTGLVRKTNPVIYEDDQQVVTVTESDPQKGKRIRILAFDKNSRLLSYSFSLWKL
jgi:hypothetical protein